MALRSEEAARDWTAGNVGDFDWSPSGHTLVHARYGSGELPSHLVRVDANGRSRLQLGFGESRFWSPDGRLIT